MPLCRARLCLNHLRVLFLNHTSWRSCGQKIRCMYLLQFLVELFCLYRQDLQGKTNAYTVPGFYFLYCLLNRHRTYGFLLTNSHSLFSSVAFRMAPRFRFLLLVFTHKHRICSFRRLTNKGATLLHRSATHRRSVSLHTFLSTRIHVTHLLFFISLADLH